MGGYRRPNKYKAIRTVVDGITFDSKLEAARYQDLRLQEESGEIKRLTLQPSFPIEICGKKICTYRADFAYIRDGEGVVEDVKGFKTPVYRLKKKLVSAIYGFDIYETGPAAIPRKRKRKGR